MAVFDYNNEKNIELLQDTIILESVNLNSVLDSNYCFSGEGGWQILDGETLQYDGNTNAYGAFYGESLLMSSAECNVFGQYDDNGNITKIGISFWGTSTNIGASDFISNTALDVVSDLASGLISGYADSYSVNAFNQLLTSVAAFATAQGLTGEDIIITGHSLGGLAVNSMATSSELGMWDGFYQDSSYVALASLTQNTLDDKVLNIGYENDPVFRALNGSAFTCETLFSHDTARETCTNNMVSFNDAYAGLSWNIDFMSLANPTAWSAHLGVDYLSGMIKVINSDVYDYTTIDSNIIVSNLSEGNRATTWVEDLNKSNLHSGSTFIIGTESDDLLKGSEANNYLCGGEGNDTFKDNSGYNIIYGGSGNNSYITEFTLSEMSIARSYDGTLYFKYSTGDITRAENIQNVNIDKVVFNFWFINVTEHNDYAVTEEGLQGTEGTCDYALSYYSCENNNYTISSSSDDNWLFSSDSDSTIYSYNNNTNIVSNAGNDSIYLGGEGDSLLFYGNFGHDTIYNLSTTDTLLFMANKNIGIDYDYNHYLSMVDNDAVFQFGDSSVTLVGVNTEMLHEMNIVIA
ncbi:lipase [Erwinia mallotivora]|uniref:Lipase n=2 Tax=Erwinia mallotivora TaxID=69222 RepID=A0A014MFZ7_9GAMM|nr:lipase [Erwinia mallotivora]EXU77029.1 lipase [Erwinia mallotivora]